MGIFPLLAPARKQRTNLGRIQNGGQIVRRQIKDLGSWTLEEKRNGQHLIELFKIFKGLSRVKIDKLFVLDENTKGTRNHCLKLKKTRCTRDITRDFFRIGW